MKKTTFRVPTDIALVKYWGKKDEVLRLPENGSLSINLKGLETTTTVEFDPGLTSDQVTIDGESDHEESQRVVKHLGRIRNLAKQKLFARVVSQNSFPKATGLSSSGSGFAALTLAATQALGINLSQKERSILARQGSGTACRAVCGGFVEWLDGDTSDTSHAKTVFPADHWDLRDVVAVISEDKKLVSTTEGHKSAQSSPFFPIRQKNIAAKIKKLKKLIKTKDFTPFGEIVEAECLEFHSILLTSSPALVAWYPGTVEVILAVKKLRSQGIECYFTINTGFNVHVITLPKYQKQVSNALKKLSLVDDVLIAKVGQGPQEIKKHLF